MPGIKKTVTSTAKDLAGTSDLFLPGNVQYTVAIPVDLTQFTDKEIDDDGNLKPGIPLTRAGLMIGIAPDFVYGVTVESFKVADDNETATIAALSTAFDVPVTLLCAVVRDVAEDILDRAYTADELAGFDAAGSKCILVDV
jgi:hypothetical protein